MTARNLKAAAKQRQARRDAAMHRPELRASDPHERKFSQSLVGPAIKVVDAETRAMIDAALARKGRAA